MSVAVAPPAPGGFDKLPPGWAARRIPAGVWLFEEPAPAPARLAELRWPAVDAARPVVVVDGRGKALDAVAATIGELFDQGGLRRVRLLMPKLSPRTAQKFADRHSLDLVATPGLLRIHRSHLYTWGFSEDRPAEFWQWFRFVPGRRPEPFGAIYPAASWETPLLRGHPDSAAGLEVRRIAAGLALIPPGSDVAFLRHAAEIQPDPSRLTVAVSSWAGEKTILAAVRSLLEVLPVETRRSMRLVCSGLGLSPGVRELALTYGAELLAPDAEIIQTRDAGALLVQSARGLGRWLRYGPEGEPDDLGPLHPAPHWRPALRTALLRHEGSLRLAETPAGVHLHRPNGPSAAHLAAAVPPDAEQPTLFADGDPSHSADREALETLIADLPEELGESFRLVMVHAEAGGPRAYGQWLANRFGATIRVASGIPAVAWERSTPPLTPAVPGWRDFHPETRPPFPPNRLLAARAPAPSVSPGAGSGPMPGRGAAGAGISATGSGPGPEAMPGLGAAGAGVPTTGAGLGPGAMPGRVAAGASVTGADSRPGSGAVPPTSQGPGSGPVPGLGAAGAGVPRAVSGPGPEGIPSLGAVGTDVPATESGLGPGAVPGLGAAGTDVPVAGIPRAGRPVAGGSPGGAPLAPDGPAWKPRPEPPATPSSSVVPGPTGAVSWPAGINAGVRAGREGAEHAPVPSPRVPPMAEQFVSNAPPARPPSDVLAWPKSSSGDPRSPIPGSADLTSPSGPSQPERTWPVPLPGRPPVTRESAAPPGSAGRGPVPVSLPGRPPVVREGVGPPGSAERGPVPVSLPGRPPVVREGVGPPGSAERGPVPVPLPEPPPVAREGVVPPGSAGRGPVPVSLPEHPSVAREGVAPPGPAERRPVPVPGRSRIEEVSVRPVIPRGWHSTPEDRRRYRERIGARRDRHMVAVARVLNERPALRGAMSEESEEAVSTDMSALCAYLAGDLEGVDLALRSGDPGAIGADVACCVSGLRLLAAYRGAAFLTTDLDDDQTSCYTPGRLLIEPGFVTATGRRPAAAGNTLYAIWSHTARRVAPLSDGGDPGLVMFAAGTVFMVLAAERTGDRRIIHLDERTRPGAGALTDAGRVTLDRLRTELEQDAGPGPSRHGPPLCVGDRRCYVPAPAR
jgi:hypothetical protein